MAQQVKEVIKGADGRNTSHGRGGAGNIASNPNTGYDAKDLATPTIKGSTYTTGRGGSGNMVPNDNADAARAAQDIDLPAPSDKAPTTGTYHWGRGGEGNKMTLGNNSSRKDQGSEPRRNSFQGAIEKGKEMLGLNKPQAAK